MFIGMGASLGFQLIICRSHDYENNYVKQRYLPDKLKNKVYYKPTKNGGEKEISERMEKWEKE